MSNQTSQESAAISVLYPGNLLMHQVSSLAIRYPAYDFVLCFPRSAGEVCGVLERTAITIVDATEDPVQAMAALVEAAAAMEADRVAVYTELMHEGLELFVRVRGAPLLLGPMSDGPWEDQLATMLQSAGRRRPCGVFAEWHTRTACGLPNVCPHRDRLRLSGANRFFRSFRDRR